MKRCPTCHRTFDDTLSFCLQDGTPLVAAGSTTDSEATLVTPKPDLPPTQVYNPVSGGAAWQYQPPSKPHGAAAQQRKVWPWILAVVALLIIGGVAIVVIERASVLPEHGLPMVWKTVKLGEGD